MQGPKGETCRFFSMSVSNRLEPPLRVQIYGECRDVLQVNQVHLFRDLNGRFKCTNQGLEWKTYSRFVFETTSLGHEA